MPKHYTLTALAAADLRAAKKWSLSRWGKNLTQQYFADLHNAAEYIAHNHATLNEQECLTVNTDLAIHPVREHYIIYVPVAEDHIVIVAFIRQSRDVPAILQKAGYMIQRELKEIQHQLAVGKLVIK